MSANRSRSWSRSIATPPRTRSSISSRLSRAAGRGRCRGRGAARRAAGPSGRGHQPGLDARLHLWRSGRRVRGCRASGRADRALPVPFLHADGMFRGRRRASAGRSILRRAVELPGTLQHPSRDGARAARAGLAPAAAHAARFGRQLRHQAVGLPLYRPDGAGREGRGPAGQVGRGPLRASAGGQCLSRPGHQDRGGGQARRHDHGAVVRPARGLRCVSCARRCRGRSIACTAP